MKFINGEYTYILLFGLVAVLMAVILLGRWLYRRNIKIKHLVRMNDIYINITHELITPLTILTASVDHLRNTNPEEQQEYDLMNLNIQRAIRLLQQLQEASNAQENSLRLMVSNGDVMKLIRQTARCMEPLMNSKGLTFVVNCKPESMMGWTDMDKLDKIVFNLLTYAFQRCPEKGKVMLDVATSQHYDRITIRVSDNGKSIPKEKIRHVFSRSYSNDGQYNQVFGAGLGLSLTRDMVYLHGGNISFKSLEGQGSTFYVDLPISKDAFSASQIDERNTVEFQTSANNMPDLSQVNVNDLQKRIDNFVADIQRIRHTMMETKDEEQDESTIAKRVTMDQEFLERATRCVIDHIDDSDYDREAFASDMGASASTLYNKLRALTGMNVTAFIRDQRIKAACQLAKENPDLRVSDIAYQVGFKDPKYFATSFKKVMGIQPKEYFSKFNDEVE